MVHAAVKSYDQSIWTNSGSYVLLISYLASPLDACVCISMCVCACVHPSLHLTSSSPVLYPPLCQGELVYSRQGRSNGIKTELRLTHSEKFCCLNVSTFSRVLGEWNQGHSFKRLKCFQRPCIFVEHDKRNILVLKLQQRRQPRLLYKSNIEIYKYGVYRLSNYPHFCL